MNKPRYLLWILGTEAVGLLSAFFSRGGMRGFGEMAVQPALAPPAILFPVVWTVLYALMGFGAARVEAYGDSPHRPAALNLYVVQLVVNFFWSLIFFNTRHYGFALAWLLMLWVLIIGLILLFRKVDLLSAWLQVPYLLWVTFAAYLNFLVWQLNR